MGTASFTEEKNEITLNIRILLTKNIFCKITQLK